MSGLTDNAHRGVEGPSHHLQVEHKNSNCFMRDEMVDFPKFGHIFILIILQLLHFILANKRIKAALYR